MTVIRKTAKQNNYLVVDKGYLRECGLSLKAKGLLTYLLALPDDWEINVIQLMKANKDGKDSINAAIKELITFGYLEKESERGKDGKFGRNAYRVHEIRILPVAENPSRENRSGKTAAENPQQMNNILTEQYPTEQYLTDSNKDNVASAPAPTDKIQSIVDYLNRRAGTQYRATSKKTQGLIKARFKEGFEESDFMVVIDKKCEQWLNDPKMVAFLRPETLFGPKFEGYLNERVVTRYGSYESNNRQPDPDDEFSL